MTTRTRRRVLLAIVLLALTLPAEIVMLKALQNEQSAAQSWAAGLDQAGLAGAADRIQDYPFSYRQQIMTRLAPDARAAVWRAHVQQYVQQHQELGADAVAVLDAARDLITPRLLSEPTAEDRASATAAAEHVQALLGRDEALYLFYYLGPRDSTLASALPMVEKLAGFVRDRFVVQAREPDCTCASGWGCGGYGEHCETDVDCRWVVVWPMCGWLWMDICDGMCAFW